MRAAKNLATCAAALVLLIVGIVLHSHYSPIARICSSGLGQLGQAVSGAAHTDCSGASFLSSFGQILIWIGILLLVGGLTGLFASSKKSSGGWSNTDVGSS